MQHASHWLVHAHDIRLVIVAAFVCSFAAFTVFTILERARHTSKLSDGWIAMAGLVCGVGTWATHFIAMISFDAGVPARYDLSLTLLSVLAAVLITTAGWRFALQTGRRSAIVAGLLIACGISTMHYIGMAALRVSATIVWDPSIVLLSVAACALFGIWSVFEHRRQRTIVPWRATIVLVLAICALHFTAMEAVSVFPYGHIDAAGAALDRNGLVALVLAGSLLVVAVGFFVVLLDRVTEREKAAAKIAHLAYHDALTGLSNRSVLDTHLSRNLEEAHSMGQELAAICIDLDGFKAVNDTFGHAAGDQLLMQVAGRLQSVLRQGEMIARVGGDEFVVVQKGGAQPAAAALVADRVIRALEEPFVIFGATVTISASVGVAIFPKDATSADDLTSKADAALYRAKAAGRGATLFYDPAVETSPDERQGFAQALAGAIEADQLRLVYQPILSISTGSIASFEALIRWDHPELGEIAPEFFIGVAEERGIIHDIGMWVLNKACSDAASWSQPLTLAVNFSPVQFMRAGLAERVAATLADTGFDPSRLEIEVTENVLINQPEQALRIFNELKQLGVRIALDDFGTGYSSLSYFRAFPFDKVKIEKGFIADLDGFSSKEIVRSVLNLSRSLGISVVAEGVETPAQLEILRTLGCDLVQGFLISTPQRIGQFKAIMHRESRRALAA
jgi:diguanylate cyclase (GGDEF)-like protein